MVLPLSRLKTRRVQVIVRSVDLVTVESVVKTFGDKRALDAVSFRVPAGQI